MRAFAAKGRFANPLRIPVSIITINAALLGAAIFGLSHPVGHRLPGISGRPGTPKGSQ